MSTEYQDFCNANYGPEDEPTREEQEGDAWEYWHQRAVKLENDNFQLRAALREIRVLTRDLTGVNDIVDRAVNDRSLTIGHTVAQTAGHRANAIDSGE